MYRRSLAVDPRKHDFTDWIVLFGYALLLAIVYRMRG